MTDAYADELEVDQLAVGDAGPELVISDITREDYVRYAGASGDFSRSHFDEPYAIEEQQDPSVYAQGMLTMGIASHMISDWFGLAAIKRYRMRFSSRVWPGDSLRITGELTDIDRHETGATVEARIRVEDQDGEEKATGAVTADLASQSD